MFGTTLLQSRAPEMTERLWQLPAQWRRMNWLLLAMVGVAVAMGVLFIYGTGQQTGGSFAHTWKRQLLWVGLGGGVMLVLAGMDYEWLGRWVAPLFCGTIGLLVAVLLIGRTIHGATSWLVVLPGVTVQPSEFAKLGLLLVIARLASRPSISLKRPAHLTPFVVLSLIPLGLIMMQPDWGSAMVLAPIVLAILFVSGLPIRWLAYCLAVVLVLSPVVWHKVLADHQRARIYTFAHPMLPAFATKDLPPPDPTREAWNARQSLLAAASGGLSGKGFMQGTQNSLGYLPRRVAPTDFIFSVIAEETGFIGSALLLLALWGILVLAVSIGMSARDAFGRNIACGIAAFICAHVYINVGMTIGMAPIIGIPLPFVSSGGSFMLVMLACIGILQSIHIHRHSEPA
jgi:rod shape determining protein RodA